MIDRRRLLHVAACVALAGTLGVPVRAEEMPLDLDGIVIEDGTNSRPLIKILPDAPVILHLWATWCPPCVAELPLLADFASDLAAIGARDRLVLVSVDRRPFEAVRAFLDADPSRSPLQSWRVVEGRIGQPFRVFGYPATFVVGPGPALLWRHEGPLDWSTPGLRADLGPRLGLDLA